MQRERQKLAAEYLRAHRQHDIDLKIRFRETGWDDRFEPKGCKNFDYDATKDETCRYTKTKTFRKHQTKQKTARHLDFYETLVAKHLSPIGIERDILKPSLSVPKLPSSDKPNLHSVEPTFDGGMEAQESNRVKNKALKSIKKREALLLQLNAVVLCWPTEAEASPADALGAVSRVFQPGLSAFQQATSMLSTLASNLRIEGIRAIEKIAAWMLFVSPGSAEPPQFMWNGQNYVMKMLTDMDFVFDTLGDVAKSCQFGRGNPLLLRQGKGGVVVAETVRERAAMSLILDVGRRAGSTTGDKMNSNKHSVLSVHLKQRQTLDSSRLPLHGVQSKRNKRVHFAAKHSCEIQGETEEKEESDFAEKDANSAPISSLKYTHKHIVEATNAYEREQRHRQQQEIARNFLQRTAQAALDKLHEEYRLQLEQYVTVLNSVEREKLRPILDWISDNATDQNHPNSEPTANAGSLPALHELTASIQRVSAARRTEWMHALVSNKTCFHTFLQLAHSSVNSLLTPVVKEAQRRLNGGGTIDAKAMQSESRCTSVMGAYGIQSDGVTCCAELGVQEVCTVVKNSATEMYSRKHLNERKNRLEGESMQTWVQVISEMAEVLAIGNRKSGAALRSVNWKSEIDEQIFYNSSINALLKLLSAPLLDGQITSTSKLEHLAHLESILGLPPLADHASLLMPPCKRLLLHLWLTSQRTQSVSVIMSRHVAFEASFELLLAGGYLSPVPAAADGVCDADSDETDKGSNDDIIQGNGMLPRNKDENMDRATAGDTTIIQETGPAGVKPRQAPCILSPYFKSSYGAKSAAGETVEEGEGHGPRKEFFSLLAKQLQSHELDSELLGNVTDPRGDRDRGRVGTPSLITAKNINASSASTALFEWRQGCEALWFSSGLAQDYVSSSKYLYAGFLFASAVANQCYLDLKLPLLFFEKLLDDNYTPTLDDLLGFDPSLHRAITDVRTMGDDEFADLMQQQVVDDVAGEFQSLSPREAFVQRSMKEILVTNVHWQFESLKAGFFHTVPRKWLEHLRLTPAELREIVCGPQDIAEKNFYLRDVFRVEMDGELVQCKELHDVLWEVLDGFPVALKRKFLAFVTGIDRLPASGTEFLKIEMPFIAVGFEEHQQLIRMLPQSHTCDNILELPNYWEGIVYMHLNRSNKHDLDECSEAELEFLRRQLHEIVHHKLKMAAENSAGYGLDSLAIEMSDVPGTEGREGDGGRGYGDFASNGQEEGEHLEGDYRYSDFDSSECDD